MNVLIASAIVQKADVNSGAAYTSLWGGTLVLSARSIPSSVCFQ